MDNRQTFLYLSGLGTRDGAGSAGREMVSRLKGSRRDGGSDPGPS